MIAYIVTQMEHCVVYVFTVEDIDGTEKSVEYQVTSSDDISIIRLR